MIKYIEEILVRDLNSLKNEILSFSDEEKLWKVTGNIKNPAGVLSQHLCGNLNHFIGALLGNTGYIRNRDLEFSEIGLPKEKLIKNVEETIETVKKTFTQIDNSQLQQMYPVPFAGKELSIAELLLILQSHLAYHLGQINYVRRILD